MIHKEKFRHTEQSLEREGFSYAHTYKCHRCGEDVAVYERPNGPTLFLNEGTLEVHACARG